VHQKRLVVGAEKLIELDGELGMQSGDPKDIGGDSATWVGINLLQF